MPKPTIVNAAARSRRAPRVAQYADDCYACGYEIHAGDSIIVLGYGSVKHERCPEVRLGEVCPRCNLLAHRLTNGVCGDCE